jgi:ArsR family transcriptional regulator
MAVLQRAGLVTCTRVGQFSHYRRNEPAISALAKSVSMSL